ncbi:site-specific integrase [Azospirillum sp. SYSU D00513]|uniref:site-specific integrase n=1 Tax=Azospirillum sp. SYSU D00513 TaxID=2812561 RepID=UPI001A97D20A|nr:site-specific integrase [Azospirillum sp. SYSU D00513]
MTDAWAGDGAGEGTDRPVAADAAGSADLAVPPGGSGELLTPEALDGLDNASRLVAAARAAGTRAVYARAWAAFIAWCARNGLAALPCSPATLAAYLGHRAPKPALVKDGRVVRDAVPGLTPSSLEVIRAAVRHAHRAAGQPAPADTPAIADLMRGAKRSHQGRKRKVAALMTVPAHDKDEAEPSLFRLLDAIDVRTVRGVRDRALILVGFAAALRRSEAAGLLWGDIRPAKGGLSITVRGSKTDHENKGQTVGVAMVGGDACPVAALDAWRLALLAAGYVAGEGEPVFRDVRRENGAIGSAPLNPRTVARTVQRLAAAAGLDPTHFAGHSLRAGFVSTAVADGQEITAILATTRHKEPKTLLEYVRIQGLAERNAVRGALSRRRPTSQGEGGAEEP